MTVFKTEKLRNEHQNSVHSEEKLKCNECDKRLTLESFLGLMVKSQKTQSGY